MNSKLGVHVVAGSDKCITELTYWAIMRKSDGFYIPKPIGRNGRGGSFCEPEDPSTPHFEMRLFTSENGARIALHAWLKGRYEQRYSYDDWGNKEYESIEIVKQPHRRADDMSVVPVKCVLPTPFPPMPTTVA